MASVFNTYKVAKEFGKEIEEMLDDLSKYQRLAEESGFYTEKAQEMDDGGLKERYEFLKDLKKRFDEREDFPASEKDLKLDI